MFLRVEQPPPHLQSSFEIEAMALYSPTPSHPLLLNPTHNRFAAVAIASIVAYFQRRTYCAFIYETNTLSYSRLFPLLRP